MSGVNWNEDPDHPYDDPYVHDDDLVSKYVLDTETEIELTRLLTTENLEGYSEPVDYKELLIDDICNPDIPIAQTERKLIEYQIQIEKEKRNPKPKSNPINERFSEIMRKIVGEIIYDPEHSDLPIRLFRIISEKENVNGVMIEAKTKLGAAFTYVEKSTYWRWGKFTESIRSEFKESGLGINDFIKRKIHMILCRIFCDGLFQSLTEISLEIWKPFPEEIKPFPEEIKPFPEEIILD